MKSIEKNIKFILLLVYFSCLISHISSYGQKLDQGLRFTELNQIKHAKSFFLNTIRQNPANSESWRYLGDIYYNNNKSDSAEICYNKGIEVNKEDAYNYIGLAKIQLKKGDQTNSKATFDKALKMMKNTKDAYFYIYVADAYLANNNFDEALNYLDKAKNINKSLPEIYLKRGEVFIAETNKAGDAANEFERALYYNPNSAKAYFELGKLYVLAWNYDEALKNFQNTIRIDSNYIPVSKELGELYYRANKNTLAANAYAKYIAKAEVTSADIARYAEMLYFSNNYQKSSVFIDKFLNVDSNNFVLLRLQAYNCYEMGDYKKGLKAFKRMYKMVNKENKLLISDYEYYAKFLTKDGKDSLAIINYLQTVKMDSNKSAYYEDIAKAYERLNKYAKAAINYQLYIKKKKSPDANDYYQLGKTCYIVISDPTVPVDSITRQKYAAKGDSACAKVIQLLPDKYNGYIYRARINSILDKDFDYEKGLAKPYYEQALQIMEPTPDKYKNEIIEAYSYLGYFYFIKNDLETSKTYWKKILVIDPDNKTANEAIKGLTRPRVQKRKPVNQ